jgi:tetratricopeptide (TPR) repeat protein
MAQKTEKTEAMQTLGICVFLVLMVLAVFGQTAGFEFVNYDDDKNVFENAVVEKGLSMQALGWAFTHTQVLNWVPLTTLSHILDCQIFGLHPGGHHLVNVFWHAATAVLLFLVLRQMTGSLWRSAFVAAVFAIHPLRAESVAWVSERKDVLSGFFFMLTIWAYVRQVRQPSRARYMTIMLFFALGLLAKSMVATLPFVLLLLDYWPLGRMKGKQRAESREQRIAGVSFWELVREKIPLFLLSAGVCVATALVPGLVITEGHRISFLERIGNALVSYVIYLRQMICPTGLAAPYPIGRNGEPPWEVSLAFISLCAIWAAAVTWRKNYPSLLMGWLWSLGMLFPVIGVIQISQDAAHADRYTYLPGIGLAIAVTWAAADWSARWKHRRVTLSILMTGLIGALAVGAHAQVSYWRNSESLWARALACTSGNHVAHYNMGEVLLAKGKQDDAVIEFRKALEINPRYEKAYYNLGTILTGRGEKEEAITLYRKALEIWPAYVGARVNLGATLFEKGEKAEAIAQYRIALQINPTYKLAHYNMGMALFDQGQREEALAHYRMALESDPDYADARCNLANALSAMGGRMEAIAQYRKVLESNPDYPEARYNLANTLLQSGKLEEAIAQYQRAVETAPKDARIRNNLGIALAIKGDNDGAMAQFRKALEINPAFVDAHYDLGAALAKAGKLNEAIVQYRKTLEINPNQLNALNNLAWLLAAAPDASLRNGANAVALAEQASQLTRGGEPSVLRTLAAAYAETGRFADAAATARRALELAVAQRDDDLMASLPGEIKLYEANTPMRDGP